MSRAAPASLPLVEASLLALWLGAALFFAAVVAPAAFDVLPASALAGALVGRVLPPLFTAGVVIALAVLAVELRWRRAGRSLRLVAAGAMLATCAVGQFVVGRRIERLRTDIDRPFAVLAPEDPRRVAFGRLHALSVAALGASMVAAAAAIVARARGADGGA